jgi:hypothetical protein
MNRQSVITERVAANRRRRALEEALPELTSLLGRHTTDADFWRGSDADHLVSTFWASNTRSENQTDRWYRRVWDTAAPEAVQGGIQRLIGPLVDGPVTFLLTRCDLGLLTLRLWDVLRAAPFLAAINGDTLAVQDQASESRLCLAKHDYHFPDHTKVQWELEVWGEPWLARARATLDNSVG